MDDDYDDPTDRPFIVTVFVKCPECGQDFLAMADEKVTGCAQCTPDPA